MSPQLQMQEKSRPGRSFGSQLLGQISIDDRSCQLQKRQIQATVDGFGDALESLNRSFRNAQPSADPNEIAAAACHVQWQTHTAAKHLFAAPTQTSATSTPMPTSTPIGYKHFQLQNEACLKTLHAFFLDRRSTDFREGARNMNSYLQVCYPVAAQVFHATGKLAKATNLLDNPLLLQVGRLLQAELDFTATVANSGSVVSHAYAQAWNAMDDILAEICGARYKMPKTVGEKWALCRTHDVFDVHVRKRESQLVLLKQQIAGMKSGVNGKNGTPFIVETLEFFVHFLQACKHESLTCRFFAYDEVLHCHKDRELMIKIVADWTRETFDADTQSYFLGDELLYDCVNYIYSFVDDVQILAEIGKCVLLGLYMDGVAEHNLAFVGTLAETFAYAQKTEEDAPVGDFTCGGGKWPQKYVTVSKAYITYCRGIKRLLNVDVAGYWLRWAPSIRQTHEKAYTCIDDYLEDRMVDIAMDCYNAVAAAYAGVTLPDELPLSIRRPMMWFYVLENDFFSYGKELVEEGYDHSKVLNAIEIYKHLHPELSYQEVMYDLEEMRDDLFNQIIRKWRGTENHIWYHICLGLTHVTLNAKRYAYRTILSKNSLLIMMGKGVERADICFLNPLKEANNNT